MKIVDDKIGEVNDLQMHKEIRIYDLTNPTQPRRKSNA